MIRTCEQVYVIHFHCLSVKTGNIKSVLVWVRSSEVWVPAVSVTEPLMDVEVRKLNTVVASQPDLWQNILNRLLKTNWSELVTEWQPDGNVVGTLWERWAGRLRSSRTQTDKHSCREVKLLTDKPCGKHSTPAQSSHNYKVWQQHTAAPPLSVVSTCWRGVGCGGGLSRSAPTPWAGC